MCGSISQSGNNGDNKKIDVRAITMIENESARVLSCITKFYSYYIDITSNID